ncbi:MAG: trypsin-like peptidase domain-containing protein [Sandaracinaceae bacterium]|nr:trypsin-like peptidase domain-containing protein [Sandaracinaceae bacterium]
MDRPTIGAGGEQAAGEGPRRTGKKIDRARELEAPAIQRLARYRMRNLAAQLAPGPELLEQEVQPLLELAAAPAPEAPATEALSTEAISRHFEKVHGKAEFLPARFLLDGAERAKAVCRISGPQGRGTGFLVAPAVLMTNNHVLATADEARDAVAELGFADGDTLARVGLQPERLFLTDAELDFTLVACEPQPVEGFPIIPLLRNPATVAPGERVQVIQHPRGRRKEVALHDNHVTAVKDLVVHYRTDTEPGSSGSPVFNLAWDLVALHHAGWEEGKDAEGKPIAVNEGVRISAIVAHLIRRLNEAPERNHEALWEIVAGAKDASPYLGFFDAHGAAREWNEVEVPDFTGTRDFADVGFWNIEHFNDGIADDRVRDVTDVVARLSMDALGLVEVQAGALDRLVAALGRRGLSCAYVLQETHGAQDLAILYDRETATVKNRSDLHQRFEAQLGARTAGGHTAFPRAPLFAEITIDEGAGRKVSFMMIVVHLKAFGDAQSRARRNLAADKLAEIVAALRQEGFSTMVGGDFNEELRTNVLAPLTDAPDLFALTADDDASGALSYVGSTHRSLIDHLVIRTDVRTGDIAGDDAAIVRLDRSVRDFSDRISDHVPVVVRLVYRDEARDDVGKVPSPTDGVAIKVPSGAKEIRVHFE